MACDPSIQRWTDGTIRTRHPALHGWARIRRCACLALIVVSIGAPSSASAARLYRWVDENGAVHYTDSIPPSQISGGHMEYSDGGVRVKTVPPVKTEEEILEQRELERLRAQQARLIEQQRAADRVLLSTFRAEDDLIMARDGKLAAIDVMIQVLSTNIQRKQEWLASLQADAADLERSGKPIPQTLKDNIVKANHAIENGHAAIATHEKQKNEIRDRFERDLERFRQLSSLSEEQVRQSARSPRPALHAIVRCKDSSECDRFWGRAEGYLKERSPLPVESGSHSSIIMTTPPARDSDIRLILTRVADTEGDGASIFLDLLCRATPQGTKACERPEARRIVEDFGQAIQTERQAPAP